MSDKAGCNCQSPITRDMIGEILTMWISTAWDLRAPDKSDKKETSDKGA